MLGRIKKAFSRILTMERCPSKLALSFCIGVFLALSTTIPFQTPLIFVLAWLMGANSAVTFATVYLINNPLTMVPIYIMDYIFGKWLFESVLNLNLIAYNPSWVNSFLNWFNRYCDVKKCFGNTFCFWCLMLGGLLLPLIVALISYPIARSLFTKLTKKMARPDTKNHEADCAK